MKKFVLMAAGAAFASTGVAMADGHAGETLADTLANGTLKCGVNLGVPGFAEQADDGSWSGFDVDVCKAVAAAIFGDTSKVEYTPVNSSERFEKLNAGDYDLLARNTTWTFSRDVDLGLSFQGVNYYDGQGFMVPASLGVSSAQSWTAQRFVCRLAQRLS